MLDKYKRVQKKFKMEVLYPTRTDGYCSCGCGKKLIGKQKRWATENCSEKAYEYFSVLKGNNGMIRKILFRTQKGYCQKCGVYDNNWEADHILPVFMGGGLCTINNFQTLCKDCHKDKTSNYTVSQRAEISSQADSIDETVLLNALEAVEKSFLKIS